MSRQENRNQETIYQRVERLEKTVAEIEAYLNSEPAEEQYFDEEDS